MHLDGNEFLRSLGDLLLDLGKKPPVPASGDENTLLVAQTFVSSPLHNTLYVALRCGEYALSDEFTPQKDPADRVLIVQKLTPAIDASRALLGQVNVVNVPTRVSDGDTRNKHAYEQIQNIILSIVVPYFDFAALCDAADASSAFSQVSTGAKKKLNELAISLAYLRQRVHVPELLSSVPENIRAVLQNALAPTDPAIFGDTALLNELTRIVNGWIRQVQAVTGFCESKLEGLSLLDDVQFWKSLEAGLVSLQDQLARAEVQTALAVLNAAKRFQVSLAFNNSAQIDAPLAEVRAFNALLRDLPIENIVYHKDSPLDLQAYEATVENLFSRLKRWKGLSLFLITRMLHLMDQTVVVVVDHLAHIFASLKLFLLPAADFESCFHTTLLPLLARIEGNIRFMESIFREMVRRRLEVFFVVRIDQTALGQLRTRTLLVRDIRCAYERLQTTLGNFSDSTAVADALTAAYAKHCALSTAFEFIKEGAFTWALDQRAYAQQRVLLERHISALVHRSLDACACFNDYLSVFGAFADRTGAVDTLLMSLVDDSYKLKFMDHAHQETQDLVALYQDLSRGARGGFGGLQAQLAVQAKLKFYSDLLDAVLGPTWRKYAAGLKIQEFLKRLPAPADTQALFCEWMHDAESVSGHLQSTSPMLRIEMRTRDHDAVVRLNDDDDVYAVLGQARQLVALGFELPVALMASLDRLHTAQPYVKIFAEHLEQFRRLVSGAAALQHLAGCGYLVLRCVEQCASTLGGIMGATWAQFYVEVAMAAAKDPLAVTSPVLTLVARFQAEVSALDAQVNVVQRTVEQLHDACFGAVQSCVPEHDALQNALIRVQTQVDPLRRENLHGLDAFVCRVNTELARILRDKCRTQLELFVEQLRWGPCVAPSMHCIRLEGELAVLEPPLEVTRQTWVAGVDAILRVYLRQPRVSHMQDAHFFFDQGSAALLRVVASTLAQLDTLYVDACAYWRVWTELFSNARADPGALLGTRDASTQRMDAWLQTVQQHLRHAKVFETAGGVHSVHHGVKFDFSAVQTRAVVRYEEFRLALLREFRTRVQTAAKALDDAFSTTESALARAPGVGASSGVFLAHVQQTLQLQAQTGDWAELVAVHAQCQATLRKQGHALRDEWVHTEQLESKLVNVRALISARHAYIHTHADLVALKVKSEWGATQDAVAALTADWAAQKDVLHSPEPFAQLEVVARFQTLLQELDARLALLAEVARAFSVRLAPAAPQHVAQEIAALRSVWSELHDVWESVRATRAQPWASTPVGAVKTRLQGALAQLHACSDAVRRYPAYGRLEQQIQALLAKMPVAAELKSDAMQERHWKHLFRASTLRTVDVDRLTVGDVLSLDVHAHKTSIRAILDQANGEKTVQDALRGVADEWAAVVFETYAFQGRCRLVRNWNALFEQCHASLATLASMKNSSHCLPFETEREAWDARVSEFLGMLNVWVEVQSHWVYLHGVFGTNSEVRVSLPLDASRFHNVSLEFVALLLRALGVKAAIDVVNIKNLRDSLARIFDSLQNTKKGLLDYLDRQRDLFPRLYFLGNDDLLELLGCSADPPALNKHVSLMFAGVRALEFDASHAHVVALVSPQGERLELLSRLDVAGLRSLATWIAALERHMQRAVAASIVRAVACVRALDFRSSALAAEVTTLVDTEPSQAVVVAFQVRFSAVVRAHADNAQLERYAADMDALLDILRRGVLGNSNPLALAKTRSLMMEIIHHREVLDALLRADASGRAFLVSQEQLFEYATESPTADAPSDVTCADKKPDADTPQADAPCGETPALVMVHGRFTHTYGFEYIGVVDRLAVTPLVQKCFLALTHAVAQKMGGAPFGPAGTGKTECVKALGHGLGRMVVVFCCDETFDYQSMARIMLGICKVGCWGCFDEFNRLDATILSATATLIERVGAGRQNLDVSVDLSGTRFNVHPDTGVFVTMNPHYAGRNELPENLKRLFRAVAMDTPDLVHIAHVLLAAAGFDDAQAVAETLVRVFAGLRALLGAQPHYDFGLRALKSVLSCCSRDKSAAFKNASENALAVGALRTVVAPRLTRADNTRFEALVAKHFPNDAARSGGDTALREQIEPVVAEQGLHSGPDVVAKVAQLLHVQLAHHGFMMVGAGGSGKSALIATALRVLERQRGAVHETIRIDSKALSKAQLFGSLDAATREWTDGLFTRCLRRVLKDLKGESRTHLWVVFDCDIDPEWAENLNSVLDDNRVLTLPNGERLVLPNNVRVVFEVDHLRAATPATVSRCGMVWVDAALVDSVHVMRKHAFDFRARAHRGDSVVHLLRRQSERVFYARVADAVEATLDASLLAAVETEAASLTHVMPFLPRRALRTLFSYLELYCADAGRSEDKLDLPGEWNPQVDKRDWKDPQDRLQEQDSPIGALEEAARDFAAKALLLALAWAYAGDSPAEDRQRLAHFLVQMPAFARTHAPPTFMECRIRGLQWVPCAADVRMPDLEPHHVLDPAVVVPTVDTAVHDAVICDALRTHTPLVLCGPPGSGKTMALARAVHSLPDLECVSLNFSKDTSPATLVAALEQHCEYSSGEPGAVLAPKVPGKWVVVFCDEINLPAVDRYGTQRTVLFLRQLVEHGGFWHPKRLQWVALWRVQLVGACNDPKDPGRNALGERFLRHVMLVLVGHPSDAGLAQIYGAFNNACLKCAPSLRHYASALTDAMLDMYHRARDTMGTCVRAHYVYLPRELTRWCRGMLAVMLAAAYDDVHALVQVWFHEALRLFHDRLVDAHSRRWCTDTLLAVAETHFPVPRLRAALDAPLLFSSWLTGTYQRVAEGELARFVRERTRVFCDEESCARIVLYPALLDHVLRVDRVLRQKHTHMMLVGASASGKTLLVRFVAWMNGMRLVQLRVHRGYCVGEFEAALRRVLVTCARGARVCFLIDESCILEPAFVERMNSLLASSEVPGLFAGDELDALNAVCAAESAAQGVLLESPDELHAWFVAQVAAHLHVVFTVSDLGADGTARLQTSPALLNRCVVNWMGNWTPTTLAHVAQQLLGELPLEQSDYAVPDALVPAAEHAVRGFRDAVIDTLVAVHAAAARHAHLAYPSKFVQLPRTVTELFRRGQSELETSQRLVSTGLEKLKETALDVARTERVLGEKRAALSAQVDRAKQMLNQMILDQNEAERKKEFSQDAQSEIQAQEREIRARRDTVRRGLEAVEPAVEAAQRGVKNIKKQHLTELRSMANPPAAVKMAMESVCTLLGYQATSWREVQRIVRKDDFIANIVNYDSEKHLTADMKRHMEVQYLSRADYNYETVNRASQACGPLVQWVIAQLRYFSMLEEIGPLRAEVAVLEESATQSRARLIAVGQMISELEESIERYKNEYSELIGQVESTKLELARIEQKVARSKRLVASLTVERTRWRESTQTFQTARRQLAGNCVLAAAFATYCGGLSHVERTALVAYWREQVSAHGIAFDAALSLPALLVPGTTRPPAPHYNSLVAENLAIREWSTLSLLVDPSDSAANSLRASGEWDAFTHVSFLDARLAKTVEDAMRFGGRLLVRNAECYDPLLDALIRGEVAHRGGQKTVALGDRTVVLLGDYALTLYTKDQRAAFAPVLESRVTLLNFDVSEGGLENAVLDCVLAHTHPDLFARRTETLALQAEYTQRTLALRQSLLALLNDFHGTMLDNDFVVDSLERLKADAQHIDEAMARAAATLADVDLHRSAYRSVAEHVKGIYLVLTQLSVMDGFYNFSYELFFDAFQRTLTDSGGEADAVSEMFTVSPDVSNQPPLALFLQTLYSNLFRAYALSFKKADRLAFAVCLAANYHRVRLGGHFVSGANLVFRLMTDAWNEDAWLQYLRDCLRDCAPETVQALNADSWRTAVQAHPQCPALPLLPLVNACVGSTPALTALETFAGAVLGQIHTALDWADVCAHAKTPVIFSTSKRFDASTKIQAAAATCGVQLLEISMGLEEGVRAAEAAIDRGTLAGGWVLLQNIQLSPAWLRELEKRLKESAPHSGFRLFCTCSLDSRSIPNGLIHMSSTVTIEKLPDFHITIRDTFRSLVAGASSPVHAHVCFLLSFYYAVVQERLKYVPLAFSHGHDINDCDVDAAAFALHAVFDPRFLPLPDAVPWAEIAHRIGLILFGGKMSVAADAAYCARLAAHLFCAESHSADFNLVDNPVANSLGVTVSPPREATIETTASWIATLPSPLPLAYIGLEADVVKTIQDRDARVVVDKFLAVKPTVKI